MIYCESTKTLEYAGFNRRRLFIPAVLLHLALFPAVAWGYLDPGSGSIILQVVLAAVLGAAFTAKIYWTRLRRWFGSLFKRPSGKPPIDLSRGGTTGKPD